MRHIFRRHIPVFTKPFTLHYGAIADDVLDEHIDYLDRVGNLEGREIVERRIILMCNCIVDGPVKLNYFHLVQAITAWLRFPLINKRAWILRTLIYRASAC